MKIDIIKSKIISVRNTNIILDFEIAQLYEVETRVLKQAVRRNIGRFPDDFMYKLTDAEIESLVSQNVIPSKSKLGGAKPFAFTEQGVAMLSSVLNSSKAIEINIAIMRTFVLIRKHTSDLIYLKEKLDNIETEMKDKFEDVYEALNHLLQENEDKFLQDKREKIGFKSEK